MTDPIRAALERLHQYAEIFPEHDTDVIVARARAALSADGPAVPEGREPAAVVTEPNDAELLGLMPKQFREDLATVSRMAAHNAGTGVTPGLFRVSLNTGALDFARAVLARYSRQPAPPAEALAARPLLEQVARMGDRIGQHTVGEIMAISDRAAAWLRENPPGQPVAIEPRGCPTPGACSCVEPAPMPVSERLPGPEDCDAEGRCWIHMPNIGTAPSWRLVDPREIGPYHTHWLPSHALPIPAGEVQP